jgi:hypothetical protein
VAKPKRYLRATDTGWFFAETKEAGASRLSGNRRAPFRPFQNAFRTLSIPGEKPIDLTCAILLGLR